MMEEMKRKMEVLGLALKTLESVIEQTDTNSNPGAAKIDTAFGLVVTAYEAADRELHTVHYEKHELSSAYGEFDKEAVSRYMDAIDATKKGKV